MLSLICAEAGHMGDRDAIGRDGMRRRIDCARCRSTSNSGMTQNARRLQPVPGSVPRLHPFRPASMVSTGHPRSVVRYRQSATTCTNARSRRCSCAKLPLAASATDGACDVAAAQAIHAPGTGLRRCRRKPRLAPRPASLVNCGISRRVGARSCAPHSRRSVR